MMIQSNSILLGNLYKTLKNRIEFPEKIKE